VQHDQAIATNHPSLDIYPTMLCSDDASVPVPTRDASPHSTIVLLALPLVMFPQSLRLHSPA